MNAVNELMAHALVVQEPQGQPAGQLFLLFHGVGSDVHAMRPLAERLAQAFERAQVVIVQSPHASALFPGHEWFSVQGVTEDNRHERVQAQMPLFLANIQAWQQRTGVGPEATALVGFSQGAIMALESTQNQTLVAARIVALSGRFVGQPVVPHAGSTLHMIHGKKDGVIAYGLCVTAAEHLVQAGADLTADVLPELGHEINDRVMALVLERLRGHIPQALWAQAQQEVLAQGAP